MDPAVAEHVSSASQGRPKGENAWYSPARDITTLVPILTRCALESWEDSDNDYRRYSDRRLFTESDISRVAEALASFMSKDCVVDTSSFEEAYSKSGLSDVPVAARGLVLGMLSEELLCAFWHSIRTATVIKDGEAVFTQYDPELLAAQAQAAAKIFRLSPRRRWIMKRWWSVRAWILRKLKATETKKEPEDGSTELPGDGHRDK